ncbi:MAG: D-alanyl-D-alanine carboxypeptidase/D-alanyl-D-alanine-endopeptidase [Salinimicrobium sp.]
MNLRNNKSILLQPLLLLGLLMIISCSPTKQLKQDLHREFNTSKVFSSSFSGFAIYDPQKKKMLYSHNAEKYFVPASNMKLFTFYTAQKILGDSVPGIMYSIKNDSLIFSGTGDPSFLNPTLPESPVFEFLKNSKKQLFYKPAVTTEEGLGPGWAWDDYNYGFSAERSQFPLFGNLVSFSFSEEGTLLKVLPERFKDSIVIPEDPEKPRVKRAKARNIFYVSERQKKDSLQKVPFKTSSELAIQLLADTLHRKIEILSKNYKAQSQKVLYSVPADSLYEKMLQDSDNFIAEQLLFMASKNISDTLSSKAVIEVSKMTFLRGIPQEPRWVDGSGLSRYNLTTPKSLIFLLEKMEDEIGTDKLFQLLPAGGESGTLKNMFRSSEPYVYAKSGSMSNIYNLSGYLVTKSGKILIFSFMNNNFTGSSSVLKAEIEQILLQVRNKF